MTVGFSRVMGDLDLEYGSSHEFRNRFLIQLFTARK